MELEEEVKNAKIQVVNKPFTFEGAHEDYQWWRMALSLYHMGNSATFKDKDYSKIINALSFMKVKGKASDWVEGFVVNEDIKEMDWKMFEDTWMKHSSMSTMPGQPIKGLRCCASLHCICNHGE